MSLKVQGQLKAAQAENLSSDPANLPLGRIWLNTTSHKMKTVINSLTKVFVTEDDTQTLTNKSLSDSTTAIVDVSDATKQIAFDAAGTTGTKTTLTGSQTSNRVLTLPDATDTLVGKATADTLTNKTLTSPVINSPTGIVKADVGLGNVDNTSDATKNAAAVTLTNKTLDNTNTVELKDTLFTVQDDGDATKKVKLQVSGVTTGTTRTLTVPDASTTIVGHDATQTLSNKTLGITNVVTLTDSNFTIQDNGDNTKQVKLEASGVTTGTTRTLTVPDANITIVGTDATQTLTNKTLTTPVIASISNGGTVTVPSGADTLVARTSTDTLTNKALSDSTTTIVDVSDATKKIAFDAGGTTGTKTTITGAQTADRVVTLPNATTTLLGHDSAQVVTAKDIDGGTASNTNRITLPKAAKATLDALTRKTGTLVYDTDSGKPWYDNGTLLKAVGSGSGGAKNYIDNGDAESGTTGWATYADAAGTSPVDGTGGSPNTTWQASASLILSGLQSYTLTKAGSANRQGEGVSYDFSIDVKDKGRVLNVSFDYNVWSGTFAAGTSTTASDVTVWLINTSSGEVIQPSNHKLFGNTYATTMAHQYNGTFQTSLDGTSYRLCIHIGSTSASNYTIIFDNFSVSPSNYSYGTPVTDWASWTPTGSWVANTTYTGKKRRVGDNYEYDILVLCSGAPTTATLIVNILETIDTTKLAVSALNLSLGLCTVYDSGANNYEGTIGYNTTTSVQPLVQTASGTYATGTNISQAVPITFGASDHVHLRFTVPIVGLSSSVQMSDQTDTRIVSMVGANAVATQAITANVTNINYTASKDTHGAWSGSVFTVPVAGAYLVSAGAYATAAACILQAYKNGSVYTALVTNPANTLSTGVATIPDCKAGDTISVRGATSITIAADATQNISITRVSGPNQIAASESVSASYYVSANFAASTTTPINFDTKITDTHSAVTPSATVWKFTAPTQGRYRINAFTLATTAIGSWITIYKNGSNYKRISYSNDHSIYPATSVTSIDLLAGDYIDIRPITSFTMTGATIANGASFIDIYKEK